MDRNEIRNTIETLAKSQGFYGRVLNAIDEAEPERQEEIWNTLEAQNFADSVDLVMYFES